MSSVLPDLKGHVLQHGPLARGRARLTGSNSQFRIDRPPVWLKSGFSGSEKCISCQFSIDIFSAWLTVDLTCI